MAATPKPVRQAKKRVATIVRKRHREIYGEKKGKQITKQRKKEGKNPPRIGSK